MKDKVVIITGASQGLGQELSLQLAKLGAKVALVSRTQKLLQDVKDRIINGGGEAEYFVCDITDITQVDKMLADIIKKYGHIDVIINNAGLWSNDFLEANHPERITQVFSVNSIAPIYLCQKIIPLFNAQKTGHFVFINSVAGLDHPENKDWGTYTASKWALSGYAKSLEAKFTNTEIKVTSIFPGPIDSNMPVNAGDDWGADKSWLMSVSEVANAVVYALSAPGKIQIGSLELKKTNWNQ